MSFFSQLSRWAKNTDEHTRQVVVGFNLSVTRQIIKLTPAGNPDWWKTRYPPKLATLADRQRAIGLLRWDRHR